MTKFTVFITEGEYRVVEKSYLDKSTHRLIEHACPSWGRVEDHWVGHIYRVESADWTCYHCKHQAPEGLQAMFWFLMEDA